MTPRPGWHKKASCNGPKARDAAGRLGLTDTVDLFFPPLPQAEKAYVECERICASCPVFEECLATVTAHPTDVGFWAGMRPDERRTSLRRFRALSRITPQRKEAIA